MPFYQSQFMSSHTHDEFRYSTRSPDCDSDSSFSSIEYDSDSSSEISTSTSDSSHGSPLADTHVDEPSPYALDSFRVSIAELLSQSLRPLTMEDAYSGVRCGKKGEDFVVPLARFRKLGAANVLAEKVVNKFTPNSMIESVKRDKDFLIFTCKTSTLVKDVLTQIHESIHNPASKNAEYGFNTSGMGKKIIIEYSSPNIAKPFHIGHLRPTIIGAFLNNLYRSCGWNVTAMNYLGDWGTQFGMIAVGFEKYGSQAELERDACHHLFKVYVKINQDAAADPTVKIEAANYFKRMEDGDESALANWRVWREHSVNRYKKDYAKLNAHFDVYTGESEVGREWQDKAIDRLEELDVITDVKGMKLVDMTQWKLGKAVLRKRDGTSIYLSRDIAEAIDRHHSYDFEKMIYVVASQQDLHLSQFFKILHLMEFDWANRLEHVNHGLVLDMSTRKGTVVFLDKIIARTAGFMQEVMKKHSQKYEAVEDPEAVAEEIAITAIKIQDLSAKRIKNYPFRWDRMEAYKGNRGPYLQYTYARLASIRRRNEHLLPLDPSSIDPALLVSPDIHRIVFLLGTYPDVIKTTQRTHQPSDVVTFCFRLSRAVMRVWKGTRVSGEENLERARARLWMYECSREVLGSAMKLLTLRPLERL